jgi:hypothetical protein
MNNYSKLLQLVEA